MKIKSTFKQYDADAFLGTDNLQIVDDLTVNAFVGIGTNVQEYECSIKIWF